MGTRIGLRGTAHRVLMTARRQGAAFHNVRIRHPGVREFVPADACRGIRTALRSERVRKLEQQREQAIEGDPEDIQW